MPLYMDFHIFSEITIDQVKQAHIADQSVQDKYNVKYHQFWVNEEAGTVFCLMEGPDKASCEAVHREAHGNIACAMVEVERGYYQLFMENNQQLDHGLVTYSNGTPDNGYRFVLLVDVIGKTAVSNSSDYKAILMPGKPKHAVTKSIEQWKGRPFKHIGIDSIIAVFQDAENALQCALTIRETFDRENKMNRDSQWDIDYSIALSGGQPVTENKAFFEETIKAAERLNLMAENGELWVTSLIKKMSDWDSIIQDQPDIKVVNDQEEKFIASIFDITETNMANNAFSVEHLSREIGISRPQLYRKMVALTGQSPNAFIRGIRMNKALGLLRNNQYNIAQIAYEVGFNNPSYFSKCFQEKFGISPSKVVV